MNRRKHAIIAVFCIVFLLQIGILAYTSWKTNYETTPLCIVLALASGAIDVIVAHSIFGRIHALEKSYADGVATQLDESLAAYSARATHADQVSLRLAREVDEELALAQEALACKDAAAMEAHLQRSQSLASCALSPRCDNVVVSAVLASKAEECAEKGIGFQTYVTLSPELPVDDSEVAAIFLYLIDGALRECQTLAQTEPSPVQTEIVVQSKVQAGQFFAEVTGSCHREDGTLLQWTPKSKGLLAAHDIELDIVSDIVGRHGGVTSFDKKGGPLVLSVLFPLPTA